MVREKEFAVGPITSGERSARSISERHIRSFRLLRMFLSTLEQIPQFSESPNKLLEHPKSTNAFQRNVAIKVGSISYDFVYDYYHSQAQFLSVQRNAKNSEKFEVAFETGQFSTHPAIGDSSFMYFESSALTTTPELLGENSPFALNKGANLAKKMKKELRSLLKSSK